MPFHSRVCVWIFKTITSSDSSPNRLTEGWFFFQPVQPSLHGVRAFYACWAARLQPGSERASQPDHHLHRRQQRLRIGPTVCSSATTRPRWKAQGHQDSEQQWQATSAPLVSKSITYCVFYLAARGTKPSCLNLWFSDHGTLLIFVRVKLWGKGFKSTLWIKSVAMQVLPSYLLGMKSRSWEAPVQHVFLF